MGPFGLSQYSLCFFIPFHPKLPPFDDRVRPEVASLVDAWKGLGLTYSLLKGLQRTSKTLKLIGDTAEVYSKKDVTGTGTSGTGRIDKGTCQSLTTINPVSAHPVKSQNTAGSRLRKLSQNTGQVSSYTRTCKSSNSRSFSGEQMDTLMNTLQHFSADALYETGTSSSEELRDLTEKSLKGFGSGLEDVMTTITGLSRHAHYKNEVKEIITVVKTANRVVEGAKAAKGIIQTFSSPLGDALHALGEGGNGVALGFNTVKIVLKGVKISKGLITVTKLCRNKHTGAIGVAADMAIKANQKKLGKRFKAIVKGLKASEGAANVVSMTKEVGRTLGALDRVEFLSWGVIMKGFKFTKSAIRVLEPLGSLPLGVISAVGKGLLEIKGAVEGFGIVVKAIALSKELYIVLLKGIGFTKGAMVAVNEFKRRSLLTKPLQKQVSGVSNGGLEEEYSLRAEVSFKGVGYNQQLAIPSMQWPSTEGECKYLKNRSKLIWHFYFTKEVGLFIRTLEILGDVEDTSSLPLSFLMLASCFNSEPCLEIPNQSG